MLWFWAECPHLQLHYECHADKLMLTDWHERLWIALTLSVTHSHAARLELELNKWCRASLQFAWGSIQLNDLLLSKYYIWWTSHLIDSWVQTWSSCWFSSWLKVMVPCLTVVLLCLGSDVPDGQQSRYGSVLLWGQKQGGIQPVPGDTHADRWAARVHECVSERQNVCARECVCT